MRKRTKNLVDKLVSVLHGHAPFWSMGLLGLMTLLVMTAYGLSSFASIDTKVEALEARIVVVTAQVEALEREAR
jgi:hypothetical protein